MTSDHNLEQCGKYNIFGGYLCT